MAQISVVVPARDAAHFIAPLLQGLAEQRSEAPFEVIVVDNGSCDATADLAAEAGVVTRVLRRPRGEGPGAARNAGAELAQGDVLAFLDADCRPTPGWLAAGVAETDTAALVQGRVLPEPASSVGPFDRTLTVNGAHGLFESANLFVRRDLFERLGGFPTGLERRARGERGGAPFGEDTIFGWRARRVGARTSFRADALVYHTVFARGPGAFVAERRRLALFPELADRVPELRETLFYRRYFHSRRSAAFDLALLGVVAAVGSRRRAPLAAGLPYVRLVGASARKWGRRRAASVAAAEAVADGLGAISLWAGSIRAGAALL